MAVDAKIVPQRTVFDGPTADASATFAWRRFAMKNRNDRDIEPLFKSAPDAPN